MNIPSSNLPLKDSSFLSLAFLKLAMAGDMESVDLIAQLIDRHAAIAWDDPQFIADSEAMRGTETVTPPIMSCEEFIWAMAHVQSELMAGRDETMAALAGSARSSIDTIQKLLGNATRQAKFATELIEYIGHANAMHRAMRDQLELLGADTSDYVLPEPPKPPQI